MTALDTRPVPAGRTKAAPGESHRYCCSADVSLCGLDISEAPELDVADAECCTVCVSLDDAPCGPGCDRAAVVVPPPVARFDTAEAAPAALVVDAPKSESWMPRFQAGRRLGDLEDWEVQALIEVSVLKQRDVCGDHLSISEESVSALLAVAPLAKHTAMEQA